MQTLSISVVIPSYNRAYSLRRALASVVSQTYPVAEIIVVDDGSTDNTRDVVAEFSQVTYMCTPQNGGAGAARNYGVERARGEWIAFLDSDDVWAVNRLEEQCRYLAKTPDVGLLISGIVVQERSGYTQYYDFPFAQPPHGWTFSTFQTYPFSTPTWLVRKRVLETAGGFDADLPNCEDLDLLAKINQCASIHALRKPLVLKYNLADSLDANLERVEYSYQVLFERHHELWLKAPEAAATSLTRLADMRGQAGAKTAARRALWQAIGWRPFYWRLWAKWLYSFFRVWGR